MRKCYIYRITNPKGHVYIGSTINLKDRVYRYKTLKVKSQLKIYNSIKKYGWENHSFDVIFECKPEERNYYEACFGEFYGSINRNGLNLSLPKINEVYNSMSEETRIKIGKAHKGKKLSEEHRKIISINSKRWLQENKHPMTGATPWNKGKKGFLAKEKNPMFGVKRSEEWKKIHSERAKINNKKGDEHVKSKKVLDLQTGIFFDCVRDVSFYFNIKYSTLKGRLRKSKVYRFQYV